MSLRSISKIGYASTRAAAAFPSFVNLSEKTSSRNKDEIENNYLRKLKLKIII